MDKKILIGVAAAAAIAAIVIFFILQTKEEVTGKVTLYTSVPLDIVEGVVQEFEKEYPGIEIEIVRATTGSIMDRVYQEAENGTDNADIIWVADFSNAEELKENGMLQKYVSPESKNIIPIFVDNDGYYTGSRLLNMVVAYNTRFVEEKPRNYRDLLNPKWAGKCGIVNYTSGASFYTTGTLIQNDDFGWGYFTKLSENQCKVVNSNPSMTDKIADGELYIGVTIDFTVRNLLKDSPDAEIDYIFPEDGVVSIASPIAISRDCKDVRASRIFIDWVLSKKGQEFMSKEMGVSPVRMDVDVPEGMAPLSQLKIIPSDARTIYKNEENITGKFKDIFS